MTGSARGHRLRRRTGAAAALVAVVGAVVGLHAAGRALPAPDLADPSSWSGWATGGDPVVVAFSVLRLVALAAAWYSLAATAAGVVARLVPLSGLASAVDRVTLPPLRRLVAASVGMSLSAAAVGSTVATLVSRPAAAATAAPLPGTGAGPVPPPPGGPAPGTAPPGTLTMHRLGPGEAPPQAPTVTSPAATTVPAAGAPATAGDRPADPGPTAASPTWTVQAGQCFWSIAADVVAQARGHAPTPAEVDPYWRRLIEANRAALADPHNPDLIFPGQVFTLPPTG